ncbi:unnamed protein product [Closterium sp. NIES-54]
MDSLRVLGFDPEGRPVSFDLWHDDLQLYLLSDSKESVSLFDHVSGAAPAPPATADGSTRSLWLSRDATARLAIRNHLPMTKCDHRTAQALYDVVVARYSSPATAAIGRLLLPYLFSEISAFATVADLVTHLHTSDARYRAIVPAELLPTNQPPMFITLYFIVTRLPNSLRSVRDHFLTLDPTSLTVDLLEQHLLAAETNAVAVGAARGTPRSPFFEGMSVLLRLVRSAATRARVAGVVEEAAVVVEVAVGAVVGAAVEEVEEVDVVAAMGLVAAVEALVAAVEAAEGVVVLEAVGSVVVGLDLGVEALVVVGASTSSVRARPRRIAAAALSASASGTPPGTAPAETLHTFTLDSGASRCFFRDSTTLIPLPAPVPVRLADPFGGPVVARSSTIFLCPADPSCSLSGLHLPLFSTHLVSTSALQVVMVTTTTPGGQRVSICTCTRNLGVTWLRQVAASCSCHLLSHKTLLWHHRLGHPSLPRLRGMHSRLLVSGLPRSLPPLMPLPAPPCLPCVEARQRAALHSSLFPPEDCSPADPPHGRSVSSYASGSVKTSLSCVCPDRGGEFSSDLLRDLCHGEGITQSFTLPDSPQQNGIAQRRIGLVMEVAGTSMIHAAAPHFLWLFAVWFTAHQLNLWPRVSLPETSPTLHWTGKVCDASVFRVWGSCAFVHNTCADKLSARAIPCDVTFDESVPFYRLFPYRSAPPPPPPLFLAPGPPSVDLLLPQGPAPSGVSLVDPLPSTAPVQVGVVSHFATGAASRGAVSGGAEPGGVGSEGAGSEGAEPGEGAESRGADPRGAASSGGPAGASPGLSSRQLCGWLVRFTHRRSGAPGAGGAGDTGAGDPTEPGAAGAGGAGAGVAGVGGPGAGGTGASEAGVGGTGAGSAGAAGSGAVDPGVGGAGDTVRPQPYFDPLLRQVLGVLCSTGLPLPFLCPPPDQTQPPLKLASPLRAPSPYTEHSGGLTERREPASRPVLPVHTTCRTPRSRPPPVPGMHAMALRPSFVLLRVPLPAPIESSLPEVPNPASDLARAASPTVARLLATAVTDPSFVFAAVSALVAELLDFTAACRLDYATALVAESESATPPSVRGECALGMDVLEDRQEDFERLEIAVPRFASSQLALEGDPDAPDTPTPRSYAEAIEGPYSSQWQAAMDAEMASWKSTSTYVDAVPSSRANIVDGKWIFRVRWPPGSPPAFKARGSQRQGVDYFQTFSPTPKMTTLRVLLHVAAQRDYELHSLDFSTSFLQGSLHEEIWLRRTPGFIGMFPAGTQWSLRRPVYGLRPAPREWHDTLRTTLAALGFAPSTTDPYLGLQITRDRAWRTITLTQSHMVHQVLQRFGFQYSSPLLTPLSTSHSLSAPPSDESAEPSGLYPELGGCLITSGMGLVLRGRGPVVLSGHADTFWVNDLATQRSSQGYTFSLGSGSVSWWSTCSSLVLSSSCEAEIYAGAMAAQELRWLTYLLTDLGEQPRSPPVLYVDNKAMIALC